MKKKKVLTLALSATALLLLIFVAGCKKTSDSDLTPGKQTGELRPCQPPAGISSETPKKMQGEIDDKWDRPIHVTMAKSALEMIGVFPTEISEFADDPDDFTGSDDKGSWCWLGNPGHIYPYSDGGNGPISPNPGCPHSTWADYNVNKWFNSAVTNYRQNSFTEAKKRLGYVMHYIGDLSQVFHSHEYSAYEHECDHVDYEKLWTYDRNWSSGHNFGKKYFPATIDVNFNSTFNVDYLTRMFAKRISDYGWVGHDFDNRVRDDYSPFETKSTTVATGTANTIIMGVEAIAGMYVRFCREVGAFNHFSTTPLGSSSRLISTGEEHWYSFTIPSPTCSTNFNIGLNWNMLSGADLDLYLYNPSNTLVMSRTSIANNPEYGKHIPPTTAFGQYKIMVKCYSGSTNYKLNLLQIFKTHPNL